MYKCRTPGFHKTCSVVNLFFKFWRWAVIFDNAFLYFESFSRFHHTLNFQGFNQIKTYNLHNLSHIGLMMSMLLYIHAHTHKMERLWNAWLATVVAALRQCQKIWCAGHRCHGYNHGYLWPVDYRLHFA